MKLPRLSWTLTLLIAWCFDPSPSLSFMITEPVEGARLRSGQTIQVSVDVQSELGIAQIRYYWYRLGEEPIVSQQAMPALVATASATPPYGGTLRVPPEALGTMRLLAIAEVVSGRLAGREEFDEILVEVEPSAELIRIEFESEKPLRLDMLGKVMDVPVVGQFSDGVTRRLQGSGTGSTYQSSNEQVVTVSPEGRLRVMGDGIAQITVSNRGQQGVLPIVVKTDGEPNQPPIANAGPDLTVKGGTTVVLNGLQSVDPDGDPLRYEWVQIRGMKVSLLDFDTPKATFVAPKVSRKRLLRFKLRVTDMKGPDVVKGADSAPAFVNVWIEP